MSSEKHPDWFARIIAVLGLVVACLAIVIPYTMNIKDSEERISISASYENDGGIINFSENYNEVQEIQVPWIFTISNIGKVKLSLDSYHIEQLVTNGILVFPALDGGITNGNRQEYALPRTLDSGESTRFRMHIGYKPSKEVYAVLKTLYEKNGSVNFHEAFLTLAKKGLSLYGGKVEYKEIDDGNNFLIIRSFGAESIIYRVSFVTGRSNEFNIYISELGANISS